MMGVEMSLAALMISLIRGTPRVILMAATPAKWKLNEERTRESATLRRDEERDDVDDAHVFRV